MANRGDKFINPQNGEYFEFSETSTDTKGAYSTMKVLIRKGGFKPAMHKHLAQDESFTVLSGELTYILEGREPSVLRSGESLTLPKGIGHTHFNSSEEDLIMYQTATPSLDFEPFVEALHYHIVRGNLKNGQPPFLQLMIWMNDLKGKSCLAKIPVRIQKILASFLAPFGKLAGYRAFYSREESSV